MDNFLVRVLQARSRNQYDRLVHAAVGECFETVLDRIGDTPKQMSPAEARGYIRARAARVVSVTCKKLAAEHGIQSPSAVSELRDQTAEQVVQKTLRKLVTGPKLQFGFRVAG